MNCLEQHHAAVGLSVITLLAASLWAVYRIQSESELPPDIPARIDRILKDTPLIDGHNDLPYLLRVELQNKINDDRFTFREGANSKGTFETSHIDDLLTDKIRYLGLASHTDLKRLRQGRVGGQFWSVFMECPDTKQIDDPSHIVRDRFSNRVSSKPVSSIYC